MVKPYITLPEAEQRRVRLQAVREVGRGKAVSDVARIYRVSRASLHLWIGKYEKSGLKGLETNQRGRPLSSGLRRGKLMEFSNVMIDKCPDQVGLPSPLWTRDSFQAFIQQQIGVVVSRWTISRHLADTGLKSTVPVSRRMTAKANAFSRVARFRGRSIYWLDVRRLHTSGGRERWQYLAEKERGDWAFMVAQEVSVAAAIDFFHRLLRMAPTRLVVLTGDNSIYREPLFERWLCSNWASFHLYTFPIRSSERAVTH